MLEILNSGEFPSPIIVFVNQKKTADMVAKDLQRAGVCQMIFIVVHTANRYFSGAQPLSTRAKTRSSEKPLCRHCGQEMRTSLSLPILLVVVSMFRTLVWSSITRCRTPSRPTCIVLVGPSLIICQRGWFIRCIGRTGRAGKQGTAITFLSNDDDEVMYDLRQGMLNKFLVLALADVLCAQKFRRVRCRRCLSSLPNTKLHSTRYRGR